MVRLPFRAPWRPRTRSERRRGDDARALRDWPLAEAFYGRHLEAQPADQPIWVQLGHALKEQGKLEAAGEAYARAVRIQPDDPDAREHLHVLRMRMAAGDRRRPRLAHLGQLQVGEHLVPGEALTSRDGGYRLALTEDGELRLERLDGAGAPELTWSSGSFGRAARLEVDAEGGPRVVDVSGAVLWAAERSEPPGGRLELTNEGALHLTNGRAETRVAPTHARPGADEAPPPPFDVDAPDVLSVVVQGPLFRFNVVETALRLEHWRALFPRAQIVFAVSSTDLLPAPRPGLLDALAPAREYEDDGECRAALAVISRACDTIVLAENALPLPPFKTDSGPNNFNLQLAAAKAGLARARGEWCLRIRSDAVFTTRDFLGFYAADSARARGATARFAERVLISPIFTLNPYTVERMPLHFSDWFHFGRLEDVRRLWDVRPMTLADATFYRTHSHASGSNRRERQFISRLAVEQHLIYGCFRSLMSELELRFHNDLACSELAMRVWADNFAMCDLHKSHFSFGKYETDQTESKTQLQCLTRDDWVRLVEAPDVDSSVLLGDKIVAVPFFAEEFGLRSAELLG